MHPLLAVADGAFSWMFPQLHAWVQDSTALLNSLLMSSAGVAIFIGIFVIKQVRAYQKRKQYARMREERREECSQAFQQLESKLEKTNSDKNELVTKLSLVEIRKQLESGTLTAVKVLQAFQEKAVPAHQKLNCLVEPVTEADKWAEEIDKSKHAGLLAGIPISIKDDIGIKNYVTTAGASYRLGVVSEEDSVLVKTLRKHGAVPFVRTNEPQMGMSVEPGNPIYGTVGNCFDAKRSPGGSSSGEGALIGAGASILGFGSDIGGSIRIPAHNNGICGFKPTSERVSHVGMPVMLLEESDIPVTWGPLARDVDSLILACKALWDGSMADLDANYPPIPFNEKVLEEKRPLTIGYFSDNGLFAPVPTISRAVTMAKEQLEKAGHKLVAWQPPDIEDAIDHEFRVLMADGGKELLRVLKHDEVDATLKPVVASLKIPNVFKKILSVVLRPILPKEAKMAGFAMGFKGVLEFWEQLEKLDAYRYKCIADMKKSGLDAILCPPMPFPALPHGTSDVALDGAAYCMLFNVLNFPAGVVRMTKVTSRDQEMLKDYPIRNKEHKRARELMSGAEGLPVGVQIASYKWQDETVLRIMKEVENAADFTVV